MLQKENLVTKFRLVFVPFLFVTISFIAGYTCLNYLLYQTGILSLDIDLVSLWFPMGLPWIPILIWLRPRIKLLRLTQKNGKDLDMLYYIVIWAATTIPTVIAQKYLEEASGKLTTLSSISKIESVNSTKFYTIEDYHIDKKHPAIKHYSELTGKRNENLNMTIFVACPILEKEPLSPDSFSLNPLAGLNSQIKQALLIVDGKISRWDNFPIHNPKDILKIEVLKGEAAVSLYGKDAQFGVVVITTKGNNGNEGRKSTIMTTYHSWLCIKYDKQISSRLSKEKKERLYREFVQSSQQKFESSNIEGFRYLRRMSEGTEKYNYLEAITNSGEENVSEPNLLVPVYEPYDARGGEKLPWVLKSYLITMALFAVMLMLAKLHAARLRLYKKPKMRRKLTLSTIHNHIREQSSLYVSWSLILVNMIIFTVMVIKCQSFISFQGKDLLDFGANYGPNVKAGQWWRLLTSLFIHGGIMHVLFNMYGLLVAGVFLEPILGRTKFALFYLATGFSGSVCSIWWYDAMVSVGASGAVFGLYGILLILLLTKLFPDEFRKAMLMNIAVFVGLNLLIGLSGGIDNAAHIGGLLSGAVIGLLLYPGIKKATYEVENEENEKVPTQAEDTQGTQ